MGQRASLAFRGPGFLPMLRLGRWPSIFPDLGPLRGLSTMTSTTHTAFWFSELYQLALCLGNYGFWLSLGSKIKAQSTWRTNSLQHSGLGGRTCTQSSFQSNCWEFTPLGGALPVRSPPSRVTAGDLPLWEELCLTCPVSLDHSIIILYPVITEIYNIA